MTDITLVVKVTRASLALADLDINDHINYSAGIPLLGGEMAWRRNTTTSAYMDGEVEVNAARPDIKETVTVEVRGANYAAIQTNIAALIAAFSQASYQLYISVNGSVHTWNCKRADWAYDYQSGRVAANAHKWTFTVPRSPVAAAGVF
jgi:hypothetical protein